MRRDSRRLSLLFPQRFLRDLSLQTTSSYIATALQLARGVVLARLLGPASLGVLALVNVVIVYASYTDLGTGRVPLREVPLALGAGNAEPAEEWCFYGVMTKTVTAIFTSLGLAAYVLVRWTSLRPDLRFGLMTACVVFVAAAVMNEQQIILTSYQQFGRLAAVVIVTATVNLAGGVSGALIAGVRGVFISQVIAFIVSAGVSVWLRALPRPRRFSASILLRMVKAGVPYALIMFVSYNLINVDQVMIGALLGSTALGVYSLVLYAGSALALFPNALATAVGPRLLQRFGQDANIEAVERLTWRPVNGLSYVMPILCALTWAFGPWAIELVLPAYAGSIGPLRVYVVGVFFLGINVGTSTVLFALNKHKYYIPIVGGCIGLNVLLDLTFVGWLHMGLVGIALGSLCTYLVYWVVHTTVIRRFFGHGIVRATVMNLASGWPGFVLIGVDLLAWATGNLWGPAYWFATALLVGVSVMSYIRWRAAGGSLRPGDSAAET